MGHVDPSILKRYFKEEGRKWELCKELNALQRFASLNLTDANGLRQYRDMDVIFCRNVLICFDEELVKNIVRSFYGSLVPGGFLVIGHTESLHRITRALEVVPKMGSGVYRRPIGGRGE